MNYRYTSAGFLAERTSDEGSIKFFYDVDAPATDIEQLYTRCIGRPERVEGEARFTISATATSPAHTIAVRKHGRGSRVRVHCAGCY